MSLCIFGVEFESIIKAVDCGIVFAEVIECQTEVIMSVYIFGYIFGVEFNDFLIALDRLIVFAKIFES